MTRNTICNQSVLHPMVEFQRRVRSLVDSNVLAPTDSLWKVAFLFGEAWPHWKQELQAFDFTMQDPVAALLAVEVWEDE